MTETITFIKQEDGTLVKEGSEYTAPTPGDVRRFVINNYLMQIMPEIIDSVGSRRSLEPGEEILRRAMELPEVQQTTGLNRYNAIILAFFRLLAAEKPGRYTVSRVTN